jgi:hypothetical protein
MAQIHWLNPVSGNFDTKADWSGGVVPGAKDIAILDAPGTAPYTVSVTNSETVAGIQLASDAELLVSGGGAEFLASYGTDGGANAGTIAVGNGATLHWQSGTLDNTGNILSEGSGAQTYLYLHGTLTGGGRISLTDNASNVVAGYILVNVDNTISGAGRLGNAETYGITNRAAGVIDANGVLNGLFLQTQPKSSGGGLANYGLIEATGAAGLVIENMSVANLAGGALYAASGASISLDSVFMAGGALSGAGLLKIVGGESTLASGGTFSLSNSGEIQIEDGASLRLGNRAVTNTVSNTGVIALNGSVTGATLIPQCTLVGGGQVTMSGIGDSIHANSRTTVFTNVDNTISGSGLIGEGSTTIINESAGVIDADGKAGITLNTAGAVLTNDGLIEATGPGTLTVVNTTINGAGGGSVVAGPGARIYLRGGEIEGGMLRSQGTVTVANGYNVLNGISSAVTVAGTIHIEPGDALDLQGTIDNTGVIVVASDKTGPATRLVIGSDGLGIGDVFLIGAGRVSLSDNSFNQVSGAASSMTLTNVDNKILGAGDLGGGVMTLVNDAKGVINGDDSLQLIIDTGANTIVNAGEIAASGAGGVLAKSAVNNTGTLFAAKGNLTIDATVTGSGLAEINAATLTFASSFSQAVDFTSGTGELVLAQSRSYGGTVEGFSKTGASSLDLEDIAFSGSTKASYSGTLASGVLTVTDGSHTAHIHFTGNYTKSVWTVSSDGHGGTIVVDPPAASGMATNLAAAMAAMSPDPAGGAAGLVASHCLGSAHGTPALLSPRSAALA